MYAMWRVPKPYLNLVLIIEEQTDFEIHFSVNKPLSRNTIRSVVKLNIEIANTWATCLLGWAASVRTTGRYKLCATTSALFIP